jgi:hypothetical protein
MSRPAVPHDFTHVDRTFLEAVRARDGEKSRQVLELHLVDVALGLVLDASPDHCFDALLTTLRGLGLHLEHEPDGRVARPAALSWTRAGAVVVDDTETSNLRYRAGGRIPPPERDITRVSR